MTMRIMHTFYPLVACPIIFWVQNRASSSSFPPIHCIHRADGDDIEGNEIYNGCTGLLYTALQLHAPLRKAAQAVLLQASVQLA